ncbi:MULTISPECIES: GGDEF domain-containing protein [unclassified Meiothermus]|uniref:GGDEF domain-containing protein n=1 Tax=unclassified Meiothermus TaxID=370471 RepID=UPI000D7BE93F|nr:MULTISPECIES: GGDEF domain-containing protein [unclassified Meiothermus]PZA05810.1 GGDEF domain-containing protein [Meiothermus sp. Pnk-1]RYM29960.1 GGDEF domain-containing protein [Meiothermus sp. PNK-Is4]
MQRRVSDVMIRDPLVIEGELSVAEAARLMNQHRVGGLPVLVGGQLVGLLTSRDVRAAHPNRLVLDAMRKAPLTISPEASLFEAFEQMQQEEVERLLVVEGERLVGVLTKGTLLYALGASQDPLTGLARADWLRHTLEGYLQEGLDPTLVFADLDGFGSLNKAHGHVAADRALRVLGQLLGNFARAHGGEAFRYAGDEFVLLFPRPRSEVLPLLEKLRQEVRALKVEGLPPLSFSLGVSGGQRHSGRVPENPAATADDLINLASQASTKAKGSAQGWVQVVVEEGG